MAKTAPSLKEAQDKLKELLAPPSRICSACNKVIQGTEEDFREHMAVELREQIKRELEKEQAIKEAETQANQELKRLLESKL